jgi:hypothetical protein
LGWKPGWNLALNAAIALGESGRILDLYQGFNDRGRAKPFDFAGHDFHLSDGRLLVIARDAGNAASPQLMCSQRRNRDKLERIRRWRTMNHGSSNLDPGSEELQ